MTKFSFPSEVIDLPSKGIFYPTDNPLSSGKVEMQYMTAQHEDILTNQNFIKQGIVLDKLLQALIVSKIDYNDLISVDKDALLIAARILGYGKDYNFEYKNTPISVDLTTLDSKPINEDLFKQGLNEFEFIFPHSGTKVTFKFLNGHNEKEIEKDIRGLRKVWGDNVPEGIVRLKHIITSVEGDSSKEAINTFIDKYLLAKDSRELRKYIKEIQPGIVTKVNVEINGLEEEVEIPIGIDFFWPDLNI
jgi:hypothetical protein